MDSSHPLVFCHKISWGNILKKIKFIIDNHKFNKIISIDNYYTGSKKNHHKNRKVIYLKLDTRNILNNKNKNSNL